MHLASRSVLLGLLSCVVLLTLHQALRWDWYIEDAGICFAYARNLVAGEGLVPFYGGERIEAYSDPTWIALLAILYAAGLDGFVVAKPLGMLFGSGTLILAWRLTAKILASTGAPSGGAYALIAPLSLAASAQFAIWCASGLENSLFCFLLMASILATLREIERDSPGFPYSALLYTLLALTRPEGTLYAAIAAVIRVASRRPAGGPRAMSLWLSVFLAPLAVAEIARIAYFAWPLPNTFYAKIEGRSLTFLDWRSRGWIQLRSFTSELWHGLWAPVYVVGLAGLRRQAALGGALVALLWLVALLPYDLPALLGPLWTGGLLAAGALLPLLARGAPSDLARMLCGWSLYGGMAFLLYADGDWMLAYRFTSFVLPALSVLFALGLSEIAVSCAGYLGESPASLGPRASLLLSVALGCLAPPNLRELYEHRHHNQDVTLEAVRKRLNLVKGVARRSFYDGPLSNLDIDQGAFMWWAPEFELLDLGKLVDVPMARHTFQQRDFIREHLFVEKKPTFANVGGWWVGHTGIRRYPEWDRDYFETPGYVTIWGWRFQGVFARRDLIVTPRYEGPAGRDAAFAGPLHLAGYDQPAPWTPGYYGYLEVPLFVHAEIPQGQGLRMIVALSGDQGVAASFVVSLGYGFYPQHWWRRGEIFRGRHAIAVPEDLPPGLYDLSVILFDAGGAVIPATEHAPERPAFARGEARFPDAIRVLDRPSFEESLRETREDLRKRAASGDCTGAERALTVLLRHRPRKESWEDTQVRELSPEIAECFARSAQSAERPEEMLARAHRWDHRSESLLREGGPVADRLMSEGLRARASGDWEGAYRAFSAVLSFQPWRSFARRYAEEARDHRLGLTDDVVIGSGGEDELRTFEEKR